jgi:hypothetical protein
MKNRGGGLQEIRRHIEERFAAIRVESTKTSSPKSLAEKAAPILRVCERRSFPISKNIVESIEVPTETANELIEQILRAE